MECFIMLGADARTLMRVTLLLLWLKALPSLIDLSQTGSTQYLSSPEVVIPLKVTSRARGAKNSEWLSYSLVFGGRRHVVHMRVKKLLVSTHIPVLTYTEEHTPLSDYPFVPSDCYYHGYVEGALESLVAFSACNGGLQGVLQMNGFSYEIEPIKHSSTFEHLVYTLNNNKTQFPPMLCSLTEKRLLYQPFGVEEAKKSAMKQNYGKLWPHMWFLELAVVVDYGFFTNAQQNLSKVRGDVVLVVNMVDSMYKPLDTYVTLVGIEIWNRGNVLPMENIHQVLEDFSHWKQISLSQVHHDAAHIFIRSSLISVLGIAYIAGICRPPLDCGVENFQGDAWSLFANTVAHELGHTFGMKHDEESCSCGKSGCVMSTFRVPAERFTNCSYSDFMKTTLNQGTCLYNHPRPGAGFLVKRCGNGMVESEEECDCGSVQECEQDPCCFLNCTLRPAAACSFGLCCKDCKFMLLGELCRPKINECDLPEWCNGTSHQCPEDGYVQDGVPCGAGAYCYQKQCNNHDQQCREIFGKGARSASHNCYKEINLQGNRFGHCGTDGTVFLKCRMSDVFCGKVHCENVEDIHHPQAPYVLQNIYANGITCWSTGHCLGMGVPDVGEVKDGTTCGVGKICLHKKCVSLSVLSNACLPETCNRKGVCNNKHHCHCDYGWSPPFCLHRGYGGSIDSGPTSQKRRVIITVLSITVPVLSILICLLIAGLYRIYCKIPSGPKETKASSPG
ncbi:disintegrin and metalloproteinase domain-containing protein 21 preproprotein [Mus musculus]|jgi:disintegrin/metalloproteinase domain-containing protein 21|uniref:Disintegrin and metalloproteinase domain-containing protein 21 n=1 Tax=Mus musculus TaxID=10090 RepID=ADA21_MOUSE|nr:disintegrin and metalloproteinase domain-containing protein 21 preproprotein [Mus musculus]Q9JI76.1 RecName: Full=Disintegrin and metalloproteinase domain-containing protein 21; Short=ADAM 21; AltName: Full=Disintegrin and metalloproteinase domain-containing protein 31; Short=ADAM 31; Flags: Precursor [Mus musculus]AAF74731.1 metalloprotease-disintegrin protein [Mus musculus]AAI32153.1 A disintegrin and metallopeptidase domain 21 [Mus musculus]AAI32345.1 A disintegrin and metallopeptidase do|eukprot:NP_065063.1 disintegrin and metalloproteinase domain-containing protein 21 preproprotein [Mus musculus]